MLKYYGMRRRNWRDLARFLAILGFSLAAMAPLAAARAGAFEDGAAAYKARDYAGALQLWQPLAEAGNAGAQFNVGRMYYYGQGVGRDAVQACKWFLLAGDRGSTEAKEALVMIYPTLTKAEISEATSRANDWRLAHAQP